jgi:HlyD family secretion protein
MKHKTWYYAVAVVLALALALAWAFAPRAVEVELAPVTQGRFEITVDEDAKTRLAERYVVSAPLAGHLSRITLREGDAVAAGAPLATLTPVLPAMLDARTQRELAARVEAAQANVERAGTRIARAEVALAQANNEVARSEKLAQQGFVAATKLDTDRLAVLAAQKEVDAAVAEQHVATHDLEQARAALGAMRQSEAGAARSPGGAAAPRSFALRAPVAGQVLRVLQGSEATVALGTPLLELGDTGRLEVVAELLTNDAIAALPGSRVLIERWGGPGTLEGRVKRVEPGGFTKVSALGVEEQRVRVLIDITSPAPQWKALGDGFRVSVRIVTLAQDNALLVPVSAVFPLPAGSAENGASGASGANDDAMPHHCVFVAEGGRARLRPVHLRGRNGQMAWFSGTLAVGTQVIVYPPPAVRDGVRIAARKV